MCLIQTKILVNSIKKIFCIHMILSFFKFFTVVLLTKPPTRLAFKSKSIFVPCFPKQTAASCCVYS